MFWGLMYGQNASPVGGILVEPFSCACRKHEDPGVGVAEGGKEVKFAAGGLQEAEQLPVLFPPCQPCGAEQTVRSLTGEY